MTISTNLLRPFLGRVAAILIAGSTNVHADVTAVPGASPKIIFGQQVPSRGSAVVQVRISAGRPAGLCSGSLIAPNAVLTAAHCARARASRMSVIASGRRFSVKRVRVHPKVRTDERLGLIYNDVAILHLKRNAAAPPLPILVSRAVQPGDSVTISGYGLDQFGALGSLRAGSIMVDSVFQDFFVTLFSPSESDTCNGDSGGPAILAYKAQGGDVVSGIVGTTSTGTNPFCLFGDRTYFANLQSQSIRSFIQSHVRSARFN